MSLATSELIKVCVVGDGAVGKTALLHSYCNGKFPQRYEPTIFDNYSTCILVDGKPLTLTLWDTAGQEDYDRLRPLSYPQTDCFIVCYSLVNPESLANAIGKWIPEVRFHCPSAKLILVGTKCDLKDEASFAASLAEKGKLLTDEFEAERQAARLGVHAVVRSSALTRVNLKHVFDTAIRVTRAPPPQVKATVVEQLIKLLRLERVLGKSKRKKKLPRAMANPYPTFDRPAPMAISIPA